MWYRWTAFNQPSFYGWTESAAVFSAITDRLNRDRDIDLYSAEVVSDEDAETMGLDKRDNLVCDQDTTLKSIQDADQDAA